jgi:hypothetical protein
MPKLLPKANQIEAAWLRQLCECELGTTLHFEVGDKREAKDRIKITKELLAAMSRDEPIVASRIHVYKKVADNRLFVALELRKTSPLVGFVKHPNGQVEQIVVDVDPERRRKIRCMVADGLPLDEINAILDSPLTRAEIREHMEKGRIT